MNALHAGATGYVGSAVLENLVGAGYDVTALARSEEKAERLKGAGADPLVGDLSDLHLLSQAAARADGVVYTAAGRPGDPADAEERAVGAMLDVLGGGKFFVMVGGSMVYGDTGPEKADENRPPETPQVLRGRAALERRVLDAGRHGVRSAVVHAALVYGRGAGAIPLALVQTARGRNNAAYVGDGSNAWSTVHVDDLAELMVLALEKTPGGLAFNAAGPEITMRDAAQAVNHALGIERQPDGLSPAEAKEVWGGFFGTALAMEQRFSSERARELLGWEPKRPGFAQDLAAGGYSGAPAAER